MYTLFVSRKNDTLSWKSCFCVPEQCSAVIAKMHKVQPVTNYIIQYYITSSEYEESKLSSCKAGGYSVEIACWYTGCLVLSLGLSMRMPGATLKLAWTNLLTYPYLLTIMLLYSRMVE
jgi:hypothetical protein